MSFVLHDDGECVGYVVVYPQFSRLDQPHPERVLYVDDVFVKRGYESYLFRLIKLFTSQAKELGLRDLPIEGVCRVSAYRAFTEHDPLLQRLGWELSQKSVYWEEQSAEEMCWLRWEPLYEIEAQVQTEDRVAVSAEAAGLKRVGSQLVTLDGGSTQIAYHSEETEEEADEYAALTEIMLGKDDDELIEIAPIPPVNKKELMDVFGILEFIGTRKRPRSKRIMRIRQEMAEREE